MIYEKAKVYYQKAIKDSPMNSRVYAMSCYMLAFIYKAKGDKEKYEEYLIRSSIGDALSATKENSALQALAVLLCSSSKRDYVHNATSPSRSAMPSSTTVACASSRPHATFSP